VIDAIGGSLVCGRPESRFRGVSIDSRSLSAGELFFCLKGKRFDGHDFLPSVLEKKAAGIVFSDGHRLPDFINQEDDFLFAIQVEDVLAAMQYYARHHLRRVNPKVVAITGTNGKSSTKEMAAAIVETRFKTLKTQGNFNNHVGLPLTLFGLEFDHRVVVLEMGMSAAGEIRRLAEIAEPDIGVITNISEAHLVHLKNVKEVQSAKGELLDALDDKGSAVINADDPMVFELARSIKGKVVTYGVNALADIRASEIKARQGGGYDITVSLYGRKVPMNIPFAGLFNVSNALAAIAIGYVLKIPTGEMLRGLINTQLPTQRMEIFARNGLWVIDDSYNANPRSMQEALCVLAEYPVSGRRFFVMGDMLELGDISEFGHRRLGQEVVHKGIDFLFAVGDLAALAVESAVEEGMDKERAVICSGHVDAGERLACIVEEGDCLLFKGSRGSRMEKVLEELFKARGC
tara:strand:+ start:1357 stop:2739 length:1383 start_codon:yes stop_codon:yes gene_type:complete